MKFGADVQQHLVQKSLLAYERTKGQGQNCHTGNLAIITAWSWFDIFTKCSNSTDIELPEVILA